MQGQNSEPILAHVYAIGQILIVAHGQIMKNSLAIWSHCAHQSSSTAQNCTCVVQWRIPDCMSSSSWRHTCESLSSPENTIAVEHQINDGFHRWLDSKLRTSGVGSNHSANWVKTFIIRDLDF